MKSEHGVSLAELLRELPAGSTLTGDETTRVFGVHHDSRRVQDGDLFVARKGLASDGARFIADARARGARAVMAARGAHAGDVELPLVLVDDVGLGLALGAAAVYEHPSFGLEVVGVTGTNGKTTTTHLIANAIGGGIIGTVGTSYKTFVADAALTTPEADDLARAMLAMRRLGATHVAMEVSSIALSQGRTRAVRFTVAALTNLSQDHLDFHGSMEAYAEAKAKLFLDLAPGYAVICIDNAFGRSLAERVRSRALKVSAKLNAFADVAPIELALSAGGIEAKLRTPSGTVDLRSPLVGAHNVENLVVTVGVICALGLDVNDAVKALANDRGAPGRLERCESPSDDISVFVDYAHTPDALARVLEALRSVGRQRILCVFGCGGDRDPSKRGPMGEAVARGADVAVVTSDNPRTEDPQEIARPIEEAVRAAGVTPIVELDRAGAIELAIEQLARSGDVVVIAGKGHEPYQVIGTEKRPFDDRAVAKKALAKRRGK